MLRSIYIILVIFNLFIFLITNKRISFLFIYFLASCLYYSDALFGATFYSTNNHISGTFYSVGIDNNTYILMIINMIIILIVSLLTIKFKIISPEEQKKKIKKHYDKCRTYTEKLAIKLLIIITFFISFIVAMPVIKHLINHTFDKGSLLSSASGLVSYYKVISTFLFIYFLTKKEVKYNLIYFLLVLYFILITILLGHRSYVVIAMIAIIVYKINETIGNSNTTLLTLCKKNFWKLTGLFLLFIVFLFSKNIYTSLFNGNYKLVMSRLTDFNYYINSLKLTEFNTIFINLDTIVSSGFTASANVYLRTILIFIPLMNRFISIEKFSTLFQNALFGGNYNMASTFIGEAYAVGSFGVAIIILLIVTLSNIFFEIKIQKSKNNIWKTFLLYSAVDISFYIHRNSLELVLTRIRSYIYIVILLKIFEIIFKRLRKEI